MTTEENKFTNAGAAMSSWLPRGKIRKAIFLTLIILGVIGIVNGEKEMLIYFPIAACFSPRIVGEALYFFGRLRRWLSED